VENKKSLRTPVIKYIIKSACYRKKGIAENLRVYTPCNFADKEKVIEALANVHTELVLIHPFREGNGRLARMLAIMMGLQAGLPPLNFSRIKGARSLSDLDINLLQT